MYYNEDVGGQLALETLYIEYERNKLIIIYNIFFGGTNSKMQIYKGNSTSMFVRRIIFCFAETSYLQPHLDLSVCVTTSQQTQYITSMLFSASVADTGQHENSIDTIYSTD